MKKNTDDEIAITKSSGNVFADLDIEDPEKYLAKSELAKKINTIIAEQGLKQIEAAKLLEIDQPKISALSRGRLDDFSLERLISFLNKLNRDVEIIVKEPLKRKHVRAHGHLKVAFA